MKEQNHSQTLKPGNYTYTYPTFSDSAQQICIHDFTADKKHVFVSYPGHRNHKEPKMIDVSWFQTVVLTEL